MNEQIRTILAEDGTKTSKIRKLLLLGLTHREIADLVTRGNRGFVWNVYKRMRDEGLIVSAGTPTATTTPELDYSFRRKFGVEIEAYNCTCQRLVRELTEAGIEVASERYNHDLRPHWKLVTDSSLNGNDTFELVSPILEGEGGLEKLERVCWVLDGFCKLFTDLIDGYQKDEGYHRLEQTCGRGKTKIGIHYTHLIHEGGNNL